MLVISFLVFCIQPLPKESTMQQLVLLYSMTLFSQFLVCTKSKPPILVPNQILVQGSHRAYVTEHTNTPVTMIDGDLMLGISAMASHVDYGFPDDRTCTTTASTVQGGTFYS